jgi:N-acetylneuraminate synthase
MKRIFEKSVVAARAIGAGQTLQLADLAFKKPGDGIPASRYKELLGREVRYALAPDHELTGEDLK